MNNKNKSLTLAEKLDLLFEMVYAPDGKSYTLTELAEAIGMSLNSISRIKTGRIFDPRWSTVVGMANFFGISTDYFSCDSEADCRNFLKNEVNKQQTLPDIATRVREMSADVLAEIAEMTHYIEQLEAKNVRDHRRDE